MVWCYTLCHAMSDEKCGDAMWRMVWYMWNMVVCCEDAKCGCGIPSDVEWFDGAILDMAV